MSILLSSIKLSTRIVMKQPAEKKIVGLIEIFFVSTRNKVRIDRRLRGRAENAFILIANVLQIQDRFSLFLLDEFKI